MPERQTCFDLAVPVSPADHLQGSGSSPVILLEYGDYECPDCLNAWPIVKQVLGRVGDRVAFVFRHFPQSSIHPHASVAAQAAEAAAAQGKFWEMHDLLFTHQKELGSIDFTHLALQLGLEVYRFGADLERDTNLRRIRADFASGTESGVRGTPTFFINGCRYRGRVEVQAIIDAAESVIREHV